MTVQNNYTDHNTSATLEFRKEEIDTLSKLIHSGMGEGYISAALLARFDDNQTFPRVPFEPIDKHVYDKLMERVLSRRTSNDFASLLRLRDEEAKHRSPEICRTFDTAGDNACSGCPRPAEFERK